ncbi:hypothetical protein EVAR_83421_1 [Eumeta japonica]|uniref:Uncharacterized protein n=1 Tax=Eumeta variegata TaxID=151549 RepID=A0A4C1TYV2_EUMVA|nr:hypothetical protein EVAR_83421_1 [Eumeta japonica]
MALGSQSGRKKATEEGREGSSRREHNKGEKGQTRAKEGHTNAICPAELADSNLFNILTYDNICPAFVQVGILTEDENKQNREPGPKAKLRTRPGSKLSVTRTSSGTRIISWNEIEFHRQDRAM